MTTPELDLPARAERSVPSRGFAASAQPIVAATAVATDTEGLVAGAVVIGSTGFAMPAYFARPATGSQWPVLLVISEIFGVHEHIADVARRFAKQGYLAVAPELFVRQGDAKAPLDVPTLLSTIVNQAPDAQVMGDLDAAVDWAAAQGGDTARLGVTGFCWGGKMTWLYTAHNPKMKAGVAWYGRLEGEKNERQTSFPVDAAASLQAPVLGLYGGADTGIPLDTVERMKAALASGSDAAKRSTFVVYPDAPHAFFADYRPSYVAAAADDGWTRCLAWLAANGVA